MTRSTPDQPDPRLDEELVAYLDGELDREGSEAIEKRVQLDEQARQQLQQFDRVWNALDQLPRPQASESFTRTTIEMVASEAQQELVQATAMLPVRRRAWRLQLVGVCAAGLLLGFTLLWLLLPNPNRTLYANLPIIEQVDVFGEFRDVDFLRKLDQQAGPWLRSGERGEKAALDANNVIRLASASYGERKEFVSSLSAKEQGELANRARRYSELSNAARRDLKRRDEEIARDPQAQRLRETAWAYYAWLSQFSEVQQAKLRLLEPEQRLAEIERMNTERLAQEARELSDENAKGLRTVIQQMYEDPEVRQLQEAFVASLRDRGDARGVEERRDDRFRWGGPEEFFRASILMVLYMGEREERPTPLPPEATAFREAVETRLLAALDEKTASDLRLKSADERRAMLGWWLRNLRRERPDVATLEAYFQSGKFTPEEQYELLSMPSEQMYRVLEHQYMREQMGEQRERGGRRRGLGDWRPWGDRPGPDGDERRGRDRREREGAFEGGPRQGPPPPPDRQRERARPEDLPLREGSLPGQ